MRLEDYFGKVQEDARARENVLYRTTSTVLLDFKNVLPDISWLCTASGILLRNENCYKGHVKLIDLDMESFSG